MENTSRLIPKEAQNTDVIFVSHSGGKDSQAMLSQLIRMGLKDKIVLIHSDLGEMEWQEMKPWIEKNSFGITVNVVQSEMDFFQMVRKYKRLPSGLHQFCTGFLKTQPIEEFIHNYMYKHNLKTAINAIGLRADESKKRAKKSPLEKSKMTRPKKHPKHLITGWLPIFYYSESEVFEEIKLAGQLPHEIYSKGFSRLSCVFCINGRINEHKEAAKLRPQLARKMANIEREIGRAIRLKQIKGVKYPKYLDEYCDIKTV